MQIGTNHLGHFALTNLLLPQITDRVVVEWSDRHRNGRIDLDDLNWERRPYTAWDAYWQSSWPTCSWSWTSSDASPARTSRPPTSSTPGCCRTGRRSSSGSAPCPARRAESAVAAGALLAPRAARTSQDPRHRQGRDMSTLQAGQGCRGRHVLAPESQVRVLPVDVDRARQPSWTHSRQDPDQGRLEVGRDRPGRQRAAGPKALTPLRQIRHEFLASPVRSNQKTKTELARCYHLHASHERWSNSKHPPQ